MKENNLENFVKNILKGSLIGAAVIVPGFSGGTVAVVLGIYNGFVGAIAGLFKDFKNNFLYLLPFGIGIVLGVVALMFPVKLGLEYFPLPTICLFVGLMLGGMPPILKMAGGNLKITHIVTFVLACAFAVGICFIPTSDSNFSGENFVEYVILAVVGALAAGGCIVPGISGSMIAMIFGCYDDVLGAGTNLLSFNNVLPSVFILIAFGVGIIVGFFSLAVLMKYFLSKYEKGTYCAIIGFILGSIFSIYYKQDVLINDFSPLAVQIVLSVVAFIIGVVSTFLFCRYAERRNAQADENAKNV